MADWSGRLAARTRTQSDLLGGILALANARGVANFSGGFPDLSVFPTGVVADITRPLLETDAAVAPRYAPGEGLESTRDAVADLLLAEQGHRPGDVVLVEEPSYLGAVADHQNPSGRTLSADRRTALVELCRLHGVLVV